MGNPHGYPSLYQVNTRVWLNRLGQVAGRPIRLDEVPDQELERWSGSGFDWIWLLGVWQASQVGAQLARLDPALHDEATELVPDLSDDDLCGSCFSIASYQARHELGGDMALAGFRQRLHDRGLRLLLDFVPNHTAIDHPWLDANPDFYVAGSEADLARSPHNYIRVPVAGGARILAHGRDPHFPGWTDTLQLNYGNPALQRAMAETLKKVAGKCDGVRCDMAMLLLPEVFERTWGITCQPFWPKAIRSVHAGHPEFLFMAEVYWDLEQQMLQQGFNYAYDKRLYDRLRQQRAVPVCAHLRSDLSLQSHLVRFLENHDEPRAAATFPDRTHRAAAIAAYLSPGMRFFHQGQLEGWRRHVPVQLCRSTAEQDDPSLAAFYNSLLEVLRLAIVRGGQWKLLECHQAWHGNWTWEDFLCYAWQRGDSERLLVAVNYAPHDSQCFVQVPFSDLNGRDFLLKDLMSSSEYRRTGEDLADRGLYLDLPAWGHHVFRLVAA
jgi:glycosidase